jgi:hypothetical protein
MEDEMNRILLATMTLAGGLWLVTDAMAASTLTMKTKGVSIVLLENFTMEDGSQTQLFKVKWVQDITDGDHKGESWGGDCYGTGVVTADGAYGGSLRCSANVTAEDGYTYQIDNDTAEGGKLVITGGKGRFAGATGTGSYTYYWGDTVFGDKNAWTGDLTINLP